MEFSKIDILSSNEKPNYKSMGHPPPSISLQQDNYLELDWIESPGWAHLDLRGYRDRHSSDKKYARTYQNLQLRAGHNT